MDSVSDEHFVEKTSYGSDAGYGKLVESAKSVSPSSWLTLELVLYGLIAFGGLVVRLAALGRWPLLETGVNTALLHTPPL